MCSVHGFSQCLESDEENGWVHGDEGDEDMTDGKHSFCFCAASFLPNLDYNIYVYFLHSGSDAEFVDVNPIGQTDGNNITHAVVEVSIVF